MIPVAHKEMAKVLYQFELKILFNTSTAIKEPFKKCQIRFIKYVLLKNKW